VVRERGVMRSDGRAGGVRDDDTIHGNEMRYDLEQRFSHNLIPVRTSENRVLRSPSVDVLVPTLRFA
jgi:hypothetical protein